MSADFQNMLEQLQKITEKAVIDAANNAVKNLKFEQQNLSDDFILYLTQMAQARPKIEIPKGNMNFPATPADRCETGYMIDEQTSQIITDLALGNNVYLYGLAGTGKTYMAEKIGELMSRKTYTINCSQWTSPTIIIGGQTIEGYKEGLLIQAWKEGGLLILDELPKLDPNTAGLLNDALSKTGNRTEICEISKEQYEASLALGESAKKEFRMGEDVDRSQFDFINPSGYYELTYPTITSGEGIAYRKNPNFCVIGTGNTDMKEQSGQFGGNNKQDYSLVDRFAGSYYKVEFNETLEKSLTYSFVFDICKRIREAIVNYGKAADEAMTLRAMLNFNRVYEIEMLNNLEVENLTYFKGVEIDVDNDPLMNINRKVIKTLADSYLSFIGLCSTEIQQTLEANGTTDKATAGIDLSDQKKFVEDFKRLRGIDLKEAPYNVYV